MPRENDKLPVFDGLQRLPALYRRHITEAADAVIRAYGDDIVCLAVCGGAGRGRILPGYSDIDLFVVSRSGATPKDRYIKESIKVSRDVVSLDEIERNEYGTKALYFLRALKDDRRSTILYGDAAAIPDLPFSLLQESSAAEANIKSIFDAYSEDCLAYEKDPSRKNGYVVLKHAHAIMKNIGRIYGSDLDDYSDVSGLFYRICHASASEKLPTPSEYAANEQYPPERLMTLSAIFLQHSRKVASEITPPPPGKSGSPSAHPSPG